MLTFREFLRENAQSPADVAKTILEQCMPYVNAVGEVEVDTILYRGTEAKIDDFIARERKEKGGVTARYSGDKGELLRNYFNQQCSINLDIIIFAIGDLDAARAFGNPYVIFPIGEFKYMYSKSGTSISAVNNKKDLDNADFSCGVANDYSESGLPDPEFQRAVKSKNEVMIQARGYLPISLSYWQQNGQIILEELSLR